MIKLTIIVTGSAIFTKNIAIDLLSIEVFSNIEITYQYSIS